MRKYLRYMSLLVLVFQMVSLVITVRFVKTNKNAKADALNTVVLFLSEILKLIAATLLFGFSVGSVSQTLRGLKQHLVVEWVDNLKVFVPAFIYTVQNLLLFFSLSYLDPATYMVTYQLKILTTAVFTVLILKRKLKLVQWVALLILLLGVCLVQYVKDIQRRQEQRRRSFRLSLRIPPLLLRSLRVSSVCAKREQGKDNHWFGLVAVLIAAVLSGFAGIYFEKILKGSNVSVWMRNVQLALFSIPLLFVMIGVQDYACVRQEGPLVGFTPLVWLTVLLQAFGGLVVALVIKVVLSWLTRKVR
ncbi:hypothetical protein M3Y99_00318300 [Aphelenchoides fujianensis]|nr:hypothetical protein M3Y99_00318300 [Aphelenchoides fujianensis]